MIKDHSDFIVKKIGTRRDKFYRISCNNCSADRGYLLKSQDKRPTCNKCAKIGNKASLRTRELMSIAAKGNKNASKEYRQENTTKQETKIDGRTTRCISTYARGYGVPKEQVKLRHSFKSLINQKLKRRNIRKDLKLYAAVDYSIEELKIHLESKFTKGMSWDNYGEWHIDHIRPDSWFQYKSLEDDSFKESWSLDNLQPLWAKDNLMKSNKFAGSINASASK